MKTFKDFMNEGVDFKSTLGRLLDKYTFTPNDTLEAYGILYNMEPDGWDEFLDTIGTYNGPDEYEKLSKDEVGSGGEFDEYPNVTWGDLKDISSSDYSRYVKKTQGKYTKDKIEELKKAISAII